MKIEKWNKKKFIEHGINKLNLPKECVNKHWNSIDESGYCWVDLDNYIGNYNYRIVKNNELEEYVKNMIRLMEELDGK